MTQPVAADRVLAALHPLHAPPRSPGWNHAQLRDLIEGVELRPAAVLLGLREDAHDSVLLTRRTDTLSQHAGQVAFPGGATDPEDAGDPVTTALRESREEIGLAPDAVTPMGFLDRFETVSGFSVTPVVARIHADAPPLRVDPSEVAAVFEVPLAFFMEPDNARRYVMHYRGHRREMIEFHYGGHRIWGATAAMICNLLERMEHHGALP